MSSDFNPDTKNVSGVQFSIASPEEIRNRFSSRNH